jgi:hypothetical protein
MAATNGALARAFTADRSTPELTLAVDASSP